ncbi:MAG: hypothetical protein ACHP65_04765 [Legionellales bacterium]
MPGRNAYSSSSAAEASSESSPAVAASLAVVEASSESSPAVAASLVVAEASSESPSSTIPTEMFNRISKPVVAVKNRFYKAFSGWLPTIPALELPSISTRVFSNVSKPVAAVKHRLYDAFGGWLTAPSIAEALSPVVVLPSSVAGESSPAAVSSLVAGESSPAAVSSLVAGEPSSAVAPSLVAAEPSPAVAPSLVAGEPSPAAVSSLVAGEPSPVAEPSLVAGEPSPVAVPPTIPVLAPAELPASTISTGIFDRALKPVVAVKNWFVNALSEWLPTTAAESSPVVPALLPLESSLTAPASIIPPATAQQTTAPLAPTGRPPLMPPLTNNGLFPSAPSLILNDLFSETVPVPPRMVISKGYEAIFDEFLITMKYKAVTNFKSNSTAKTAAETLIWELTVAKYDFVNSKSELEGFKTACDLALTRAQGTELANHRDFLGVICSFIKNFFVVLGKVIAGESTPSMKFFDGRTDTMKKIDELQQITKEQKDEPVNPSVSAEQPQKRLVA